MPGWHGCGRNLAKVGVGGSNPLARSKDSKGLGFGWVVPGGASRVQLNTGREIHLL